MAQGAKPSGVAPNGKVGFTGVWSDSGRPVAESWHRFPILVWMALEVDSGPRDPPRETGWLIVVVVVVVSLCAVQVALMKENGNQSGTRTVHTPSNQVFL